MTGFHQMIRSRVAEAEDGLEEAARSHDDYHLEIRLGELESLVRLAADHGVLLTGAEQLFARHGRAAPDLTMTGPIDLAGLAAG